MYTLVWRHADVDCVPLHLHGAFRTLSSSIPSASQHGYDMTSTQSVQSSMPAMRITQVQALLDARLMAKHFIKASLAILRVPAAFSIDEDFPVILRVKIGKMRAFGPHPLRCSVLSS